MANLFTAMTIFYSLAAYITLCAAVALHGEKREMGYFWALAICFFATPVIGLIVILADDKVEAE